MLINCPECQKEISDTAPTCPGCGAFHRHVRHRHIYIMLALLLGCLGIHDIYIGRWQRTIVFVALFLLNFVASGVGLFFACTWIIAECFTMKTDAEGHPLL